MARVSAENPEVIEILVKEGQFVKSQLILKLDEGDLQQHYAAKTLLDQRKLNTKAH